MISTSTYSCEPHQAQNNNIRATFYNRYIFSRAIYVWFLCLVCVLASSMILIVTHDTIIRSVKS